MFLTQGFGILSSVMFKRFLLAWGLAIILLLPFDVKSAELTNAQILKNFETVVFKVEAGESFVAPDGTVLEWRLAKWLSPVRVVIFGRYLTKYASWIEEHMSDLESLTGLDIEMVPRESANVAVIFSEDLIGDALGKYRGLFRMFFEDDERMERAISKTVKDRNALCFSRIGASVDNISEIITSIIIIPSNMNDGVVYKCLIEELTQMLGIPNDSDNADHSIFNDKSRYVDLTENDRTIVRMLYDPRMKAGMTWSEAEPIAREILEELRPGG